METEQYTRITVPLSRQEWEALRNVSQQEYRHPREQARYLLRRVLFGEPVASKQPLTGATTEGVAQLFT